jgi:acyl carrier protein
MTQNDIRTRIKQTIAKVLRSDADPASLESADLIHALGISSIDALEILINMEVEFGIEVADDDLSQELVSSVDALEQYVRQRLPATA